MRVFLEREEITIIDRLLSSLSGEELAAIDHIEIDECNINVHYTEGGSVQYKTKSEAR